MPARRFFDRFPASEGGKDEWLTPLPIIKALGPFDLDPCAPLVRPWPTAAHHLTEKDDGLATTWPADAFVWCNPPYGAQLYKWLEKCANHPGGAIALTFSRTDTRGFQKHAFGRASAMLFIAGRLRFCHVDGTTASASAGAPSVLIAYGSKAARRLDKARGLGTYLPINNS